MKVEFLSAFLAVLLLSAAACGPPLVRSARARVTAPDVAASDVARQVSPVVYAMRLSDEGGGGQQ